MQAPDKIKFAESEVEARSKTPSLVQSKRTVSVPVAVPPRARAKSTASGDGPVAGVAVKEAMLTVAPVVVPVPPVPPVVPPPVGVVKRNVIGFPLPASVAGEITVKQ